VKKFNAKPVKKFSNMGWTCDVGTKIKV